jgi:hypothetical protein
VSGDSSRFEDLRAVWAASEMRRSESFEAFEARFSASVGLPDEFEYGALTAEPTVPGYVPYDLDALFPFWALENMRRELRASSRLRRLLDDPAAVNGMKPSELAATVCAGFGVERASIASFDPRQNRAWFVAAFLLLHARAFGEPPEILGGSAADKAAFARECQCVALFRLGRLCEWWRWRSAGLERAVVAARDQKAKQRDAWRSRERQGEERDAILAAMLRRRAEGKTITQAARATFEVDGLGASAGANVSRLKRHLRREKRGRA